MKRLGQAWAWVRAHGSLLAGATIAVLAFLLYRRNRADQVTSLRGALAVAKAERDVAALTERRDAALARADATEADVRGIDEKLAETRQRIVEHRTGASNLNAEQVLAEYRRLGYLK